MSSPRPISRVKRPGVFQIRVLRVLAEHGPCNASKLNYLFPKSPSIDTCDRAFDGLYRQGLVAEMEYGNMPIYGLSERGIAWLEKEAS